MPGLEELALFLESRIWDHDGAQTPYEARMNGSESGKLSDPSRAAESAAEYVLRTYDADFIPTVRAKAREGGRKSKRGKSFTLTDYERVRHLSLSKAAKELGCSVDTVRRRAREWDALQQRR